MSPDFLLPKKGKNLVELLLFAYDYIFKLSYIANVGSHSIGVDTQTIKTIK